MRARPLAVAFLAAALFGAATPASKLLLSSFTPFQLAGILYLGAALGVLPAAWQRTGIRTLWRADRRNRLRLLGAIGFGGIAGPVLLLLGLRQGAAASVSLWLSSEIAATALLGVLLFRDRLGSLGWAGVLVVFAATVLLSAPEGNAGLAAGGLVVLACVCWGLDNHWTALLDAIRPSESALVKSLVAGATNLAIGLALDPLQADPAQLLAALFVGAWTYGVSMALYIAAAQGIGATRAQLAFASAPFFGVVLAVLALREPLHLVHVASGLLFLAGSGLLLLERHSHVHAHAALEHEHSHRHDDGHHDHTHAGMPASTRHTHRHRHEPLVHAHPHVPYLHHRHHHRHRADAAPSEHPRAR
ncbi:MAG: DMT family transporter [Planctomycetota bacterium]|nr:MAG: DMT family transporter [Planctomycetota bacterium]